MQNIGITGTRNGMTQNQKEVFIDVLEHVIFLYPEIEQFHHGQCIGVDVEAAVICEDYFDLRIVSHPPIKNNLIGICTNHIVKPAAGYFERNRDIVLDSDLMFVIPFTEEKQDKGGTWYTFNYSLKLNKPTILILPSGKIELFNFELNASA